LSVVASDRNEISVEERPVLVVGECLLVHALAEAAPERGKKKHYRLILVASESKRIVAPFAPMD
jgi:hypothetical protein